MYRCGVAIKMIKVDEHTHARLVELAAEQGTTIGVLVGDLAGAPRTHTEWEAIARQTRDYVREHLGYDPTPAEQAEWEAEHTAVMADLDGQFAARGQARRATA